MQNNIPKVILFGGAPMTGKTTIARMVAAEFSYSCISTDDLGEAVRAINPDSILNPMKEYDYWEYYIKKTKAELTDDFINQHNAMRPAIEAVINSHANWSNPIVIEGWNLYPEWINELNLSNVFSFWFLSDETLLTSRIHTEVEFYSRASNPKLMIQKYITRSLEYNKIIEEQLEQTVFPSIKITSDMKKIDIFNICLEIINP